MKYYQKLTQNDSGELVLIIPDELLSKLGWSVDDELQFHDTSEGIHITKKDITTSDVELEFTEKEALDYMMRAHEAGLSFNQWITMVLSEYLDNHPDESE